MPLVRSRMTFPLSPLWAAGFLLLSGLGGCAARGQQPAVGPDLQGEVESQAGQIQRLKTRVGVLEARLEAVSTALEQTRSALRGVQEELRVQAGAGGEERVSGPAASEEARVSSDPVSSAPRSRGRTGPPVAPPELPELSEGRALFDRGAWEAAAAAFQRHVRLYPQHPSVPDAMYWAAECYLRLGEQRLAVSQLRALRSRYAAHPRTADALMWLVHTHRALGEPNSADEALRELFANHPGSAAAEEARSAGMVVQSD